MQLATNWMAVESTAWILTLKHRSKPLPLRRAAKSGLACWRPVDEWLKPVAGKPGLFRTVGVGRDRELEMLPF
jgi:hypothetical protein